MTKTMLSVCTMLTALGIVGSVRAADEHPGGEAVAVLLPKAGGDGVHGTILLKQEKGYVQVTGQVDGLKPGKHGFHIHMYGDTRSADGLSTGGHYNPEGHPHGSPTSKEHHEGDLGNIDAGANGVAKVNVKAEGLELHHVLGRAIVVHGKADDLKSQPAGDAGPRIAVGVIGLAEPPKK